MSLDLYRRRCSRIVFGLLVLMLMTSFDGVTRERDMADWNLQLMLLNSPEHPLISRDIAERLALLIVEERYPKDFFDVGSVNTMDDRDQWRVEVINRLTENFGEQASRTADGRVLPAQLTFRIRKFDGQITSVL